MNIILFGPPGAGKGTQGDNLVKDLNLFKVSTGDLLRAEINKQSVLGIKIKSVIDQGLLASDDIINNLIEKVISNKSYYNRLIFDGYPRNLNQTKKLDALLKKYNQKVSCVFSLLINKDIIIKRILGRLVCSKCGLTFNKYFNPPQKAKYNCNLKYLITRADDNEKAIRNRIETYFKETISILDYYVNKKILYEINGMGEVSQIYKEIRGILTSLET